VDGEGMGRGKKGGEGGEEGAPLSQIQELEIFAIRPWYDDANGV